ncbi:MAG: hypothetical protein ACLR6B_13820 [Blautia sp.]
MNTIFGTANSGKAIHPSSYRSLLSLTFPGNDRHDHATAYRGGLGARELLGKALLHISLLSSSFIAGPIVKYHDIDAGDRQNRTQDGGRWFSRWHPSRFSCGTSKR